MSMNTECHRLDRILSDMGEPVLPYLTNNVSFECYRFLRWSAWSSPISVCLTKTGAIFSVRTTTSRLMRTTTTESPYETTQSQMSASESTEIRELLNKVDVFHMAETSYYVGCDGCDWFLEGVSGGVYRVISRWSPDSPNGKERGLEAYTALGNRLWDYGKTNRYNKSTQAIMEQPKGEQGNASVKNTR